MKDSSAVRTNSMDVDQRGYQQRVELLTSSCAKSPGASHLAPDSSSVTWRLSRRRPSAVTGTERHSTRTRGASRKLLSDLKWGTTPQQRLRIFFPAQCTGRCDDDTYKVRYNFRFSHNHLTIWQWMLML